MLIGFLGGAGSGKDTAAEALVAAGWRRVAFADPVRQMALAIDPYVLADGEPVLLGDLVASVGWDEAKRHPDVRRILQRVGTEAGRGVIGDNVWTMLASRAIAAAKGEGQDRIVITDVRFPNEADFIRNKGGLLIKIERPDLAPLNGHASEIGQYVIKPDAIIVNDSTIDDLRRTTLTVVADWLDGIFDE